MYKKFKEGLEESFVKFFRKQDNNKKRQEIGEKKDEIIRRFIYEV